MKKMEVISPVGGGTIKQKTIAPRLDNFEGKTVCETWNGVFKGDYTFPIFRELLKKKYPGVKVIPYTEFPFFYGGDTPAYQKELAKQKAALAKEKGCDALISGTGA